MADESGSGVDCTEYGVQSTSRRVLVLSPVRLPAPMRQRHADNQIGTFIG